MNIEDDEYGSETEERNTHSFRESSRKSHHPTRKNMQGYHHEETFGRDRPLDDGRGSYTETSQVSETSYTQTVT